MAQILDILSRAGRAMGTLRQGQVPTGADATDMLEQLQDIINDQVLRPEQPWTDVILMSAADYEASDGQRITVGEYTTADITLPTTYEDDCGNTLPTRDLARVQIIGSDHELAGLWVWSASKGAWSQCDGLEVGSQSPFGDEDTRGLACMVAVAMVDEYGGEISAVTVSRAQAQANSFRARMYRDVTVRADLGFYRTSDMGYRNDGWDA